METDDDFLAHADIDGTITVTVLSDSSKTLTIVAGTLPEDRDGLINSFIEWYGTN